MTTPSQTLQFVLDDADPAHARILALIAAVREFSLDMADKTDSDIVNEALHVLVERGRMEAGLRGRGEGDPNADTGDIGDTNAVERSTPVHLWLDDLRPAPGGWTHVRTAPEAIAAISAGGVVAISLDHDLGDEEGVGTGYDVAVWIENGAADGTLARFTWAIHSANPVGRARMTAALASADRFWDRGGTRR